MASLKKGKKEAGEIPEQDYGENSCYLSQPAVWEY